MKLVEGALEIQRELHEQINARKNTAQAVRILNRNLKFASIERGALRRWLGTKDPSAAMQANIAKAVKCLRETPAEKELSTKVLTRFLVRINRLIKDIGELPIKEDLDKITRTLATVGTEKVTVENMLLLLRAKEALGLLDFTTESVRAILALSQNGEHKGESPAKPEA